MLHFGVSNFGWPQLQLLQSCLTQPLLVNQLEMSLAKIDWLEQNVLTGMVQAYIFSILAAVYIAAATRTRTRKAQRSPGA